jgi:flagellar L-ring protein FlgH
MFVALASVEARACHVYAAALLAGCSAADRFANIGAPPNLSAIENPTTQAGYRPVHMPMPDPVPAAYNPNSLWRSGSRAFFKDQRAHQVGDILTVKVQHRRQGRDRQRNEAQPPQQR